MVIVACTDSVVIFLEDLVGLTMSRWRTYAELMELHTWHRFPGSTTWTASHTTRNGLQVDLRRRLQIAHLAPLSGFDSFGGLLHNL